MMVIVSSQIVRKNIFKTAAIFFVRYFRNEMQCHNAYWF